jgi:hypothetical protein
VSNYPGLCWAISSFPGFSHAPSLLFLFLGTRVRALVRIVSKAPALQVSVRNDAAVPKGLIAPGLLHDASAWPTAKKFHWDNVCRVMKPGLFASGATALHFEQNRVLFPAACALAGQKGGGIADCPSLPAVWRKLIERLFSPVCPHCGKKVEYHLLI